MFGHLDDPAPPVPDARTLRAVVARAARLRRRRVGSALAVVGAAALALGLVAGLSVGATGSTSSVAAFDARVGTVPPGTAVPQADVAEVVFVDDAHGFALALRGEQTVLAATDDAGRTWRVVSGRLPTSLPAQIEFVGTTHGYLWGGPPTPAGAVPVWRTTNGGRTWSRAAIGPVVSDVSAIGPDVWAVVGDCALTTTTSPPCPVTVDVSLDGGATWAPSAGSPAVVEDPELSVGDQDLELARMSQAHAYVLAFGPLPAGGRPLGRLVYTADAGRTWVGRADPCPAAFGAGQQLAGSGTLDLWLVCGAEANAGSQAKELYRSEDGGRTWSLASAADAPVLSDGVSATAGAGLPLRGYVSPYALGHDALAVLTPTQAWLFPDRSGVFATTDGGGSWSEVASLVGAGFVGDGSGNVVFVDARHGWVCEAGTGLWRTTDGLHWQRLG